MPAETSLRRPANYLSQIGTLTSQSILRLIRAPMHSRRAEARRSMARRWLWLTALAAVAIVVLAFSIDVAAIRLMPARGTAALWPVRLFTDLAKSSYVLLVLAAVLLLVVVLLPRLRGTSRSVLAAFSIRIQFLFFSVLVAMILGEILKLAIGRGRPFVGGDGNAFNFSPFARTEAFASFPSGHALAAFALAYGVSSLWPRLSGAIWTFAILICVSRVVLLAHHPSDVVAGALTGVVGAMAVRYWFAARRLGFKIDREGYISPLQGPSPMAFKRVAREAFAP